MKMALETRDGNQILPDAKDYLHYFQLEKDPFPAEDTFYFESRSQPKTLDRLCHLCRFGELVMLIVGKPGMGKTTLKRAICERLDTAVSISQVDATLMMTEEKLLHEVAIGFDLAVTDAMASSDLLKVLVRYGEEMSADARINLVVVDDAGELGEYALRCLLDLAVKGQIHLMLLADPGLPKRDEMRALGDQLYQFDLARFERADVLDYLQARFANAGSRSASPFSRMHIDTIFNKSKGNPALINQQAENLLVAMMSEGHNRKLGLPMGHMAAVVAVGGVLVLAFLFRNDMDGLDLNQVIREEPVLESLPVDQAGRSPIELSPIEPATRVTSLSEAQLSAARERPVVADEEKPAATRVVDASAPAVTGALGSSNPSELQAEQVDVDSSLAGDSAAARVDPDSERLDSDTEAAAASVELPAAASEPVTRLVNGGRAALPALIRKSPYKTEGWLMNVASDRYTLQLLGARSEDRVIEFIEQQRNPTEFAYFETRYQSEIWFVVVLGNYTDRQAALLAIDRLPPEIRRENPWARSMQSVQENINQQRDR